MKTIYLLSFVLMLSCSKKKELEDDSVFAKPDQIDYYYLSISEKELAEIFKRENMSRHERILAEILYHDEPVTVTDTTFITDMEIMPYFHKTTVDKKRDHDILQTFSPGEEMSSASFAASVATCAPTYRDILVFRKKNKIIGFAKVCFECDHTHAAGGKSSGVHVDYKTLESTLKKVPRN